MASRLYGKDLVFKIGTTDYKADITECSFGIKQKPDDERTFGAGDNYQWTLKVKALQSLDATSFHQFLIDNVDKTMAFTFAPAGNPAPSVAQPHWLGNVVIASPNTLGGKSDPTKPFSFEVELVCEGTPTKKTAP